MQEKWDFQPIWEFCAFLWGAELLLWSLAWAVLKEPAVIWGTCSPPVTGAAPPALMSRQTARSEHFSSSSKHQLDMWNSTSHPTTPQSQEQGLPRYLGSILVSVKLHVALYWALLLMCKVEMMTFRYPSRARGANMWWKHQSITVLPTPWVFTRWCISWCALCPEFFTIHR